MGVRIELKVPVTIWKTSYQVGRAYMVSAALAKELIECGAAVAATPASTRKASPQRSVRKTAGEDTWQSRIAASDTFDWETKLKLPYFSQPKIQRRYRLERDRSVAPTSRRSSNVIVAGYGESPRRPQSLAVEYLIEHEAELFAKFVSALGPYAIRTFRTDWIQNTGLASADRIVPAKMTSTDVTHRISVSHIVISNRLRARQAYIEICGNCSWDPEHGYCVVLHRKRIVGVGQSGWGWVDRVRSKRPQ